MLSVLIIFLLLQVHSLKDLLPAPPAPFQLAIDMRAQRHDDQEFGIRWSKVLES
jgi:hypothetical protein